MDNPEPPPASPAIPLSDGPPQEWITAVEAAYVGINNHFGNPSAASTVNAELAITLHPDWGDYPPSWWLLAPDWLRATITDAANYRHMIARNCDAETISLTRETKSKSSQPETKQALQ